MKTAGRWPWKSESARDRVTTHLPNCLALKMDDAQASSRMAAVVSCLETTSRRDVAVALKANPCEWLEQLLVQILVLVATIQMKSLDSDVRKGST